MKSITLLASVLTLSLAAGAAGPRTATAAADASPVTTTLKVPFATDISDPKTGESVRLNLEANVVSTVAFKEGGGAEVALKCEASGTGTGLSTNNSYPFTIADETTSDTDGAYPAQINFTCRSHLLSPGASMGSDGDLFVNTKIKLTVNADGTTAATNDGMEVAK